MSDKLPIVSIVVPSYNHATYITQCIESIVNQDYENYELIVIDDGSTDESPILLKKLQKKYHFYLEFNPNQGSSKTLTRGFKDIAKGKYFTFCSSDDYWLPGKLRKQISFLEKNPDYAMVFGKVKIIDEHGNFDITRTTNSNKKLKGGRIFKDLINLDFFPPGNSVIRAKVIQELGYYRGHIWAEDFDMFLRISVNYPIGFINDDLSVYRVNYSIPSKNLNFKTIYSHRDSILQFRNSAYFNEAMKNWHFRCFTWYAPFTKGKKLAIKGMFHNLDKILTKPFIISFLVLIFKWHNK
jgi:alpha-1,3-rhamnosyltransferase